MDSRFRINSAILYTLENASAEGSLYLPRDILIRRTKSILGFRDAYDAYMPQEDDALVPEALEGTNDPVGAGILDLAVEKKGYTQDRGG